MNPKNDVAGRAGYQDIARAKAIDSKTVKLTFTAACTRPGLQQPVRDPRSHRPPGQGLLTRPGTSNVVNSQTTGKPIGSGPFILESYTKGQSMTMVRNPKYYGKAPKIGKIVFRFITNTDSEIQAIKGGEVDAIYPQPQLQLGDLRKTSGAQVLSSAGATYEHIDFNAAKRASRSQGLRGSAGIRPADRPRTALTKQPLRHAEA